MSWTKCERLTSEPREILTSQQGMNEPPMAVIHDLRNQVVMVRMPPLDPVVRTVTTENATIVKHLMTVGMTIRVEHRYTMGWVFPHRTHTHVHHYPL